MSKPQALCIHTAYLTSLAYSCGFPRNPETGIVLFSADEDRRFIQGLNRLVNDVWYIPRAICETSPDFRQLLPYVVIINHKGDILCYNRPAKEGGEGRLAGKFSIGFGGHVEPEDWSCSPWTTCFAAAERELREELHMEDTGNGIDPMYTLYHTLAALILSNDTPVDSVHLGIALVAKWESADAVPSQIVSNEPDQICNLRTLTLEQAKAEANPESWTAKILASGLLEKFV